MTELTKHALGDAAVADMIVALPRQDLEKVAATTIAIVKHRPRTGGAKIVFDNSLKAITTNVKPLGDEALNLMNEVKDGNL